MAYSENLPLKSIQTTQSKITRPFRVENLVRILHAGESLSPIDLIRDSDGTIQILNGHHRAVSYFLSGRSVLYPHEYCLEEVEHGKKTFGTIEDLVFGMV